MEQSFTRAVGSLVVRTSDSRPEGLGLMPPNTLRVHTDLHAEIVEVEIQVVSPSIVPSGNFAELNRTITCMVLKANDRRTSCPCHDEFRGPRSDYVRQNLGGRTGKILRPSSVALKSKNQEISRLQLAVKLPWAIFFESVDILS
ncbi:hypothetical protein TNCV_2607061 [Trichonephila clavipes]|uniref:Uncharacterized protein n=1 Tax=Trichonephila clavipes TaxID=2585209 RepID=A0A8X6V6V7_TRICX|nr:hypothetical protein TNCV_2607061 [Trichonephila clavipes]